jgi:hypothetical protein
MAEDEKKGTMEAQRPAEGNDNESVKKGKSG